MYEETQMRIPFWLNTIQPTFFSYSTLQDNKQFIAFCCALYLDTQKSEWLYVKTFKFLQKIKIIQQNIN